MLLMVLVRRLLFSLKKIKIKIVTYSLIKTYFCLYVLVFGECASRMCVLLLLFIIIFLFLGHLAHISITYCWLHTCQRWVSVQDKDIQY